MSHESMSLRGLAKLVQEMMGAQRDYDNSDRFPIRRHNYEKYIDLEKKVWAVTKEVLKSEPSGEESP